jgi:hypothetical protein
MEQWGDLIQRDENHPFGPHRLRGTFHTVMSL